MDRIYNQLDKITDHLEKIAAEQAAIKSDLAYHIRRTDLLEEEVNLLEEKLLSTVSDITKFKGFFTIGGWLVGIISTLLTILTLSGHLFIH